MNEARAIYRENHGHIRGLARYSKDRDAKLRELCDSRKFWFGDTWSRPATAGAQAALKTLIERQRGTDPLRLLDMVPQEFRTAANLKAMHNVVLCSLRLAKR